MFNYRHIVDICMSGDIVILSRYTRAVPHAREYYIIIKLAIINYLYDNDHIYNMCVFLKIYVNILEMMT